MNKWRKVVVEMLELRKEYQKKRVTESISVHRTLIHRALPGLYSLVPEAEAFYEPMHEQLAEDVTSPDRVGDREKGMGKHYYCAANFMGMRLYPSEGYYKNGIIRFSPSARTMFEEDYTMALTMHRAGFLTESANYLARAIHMVSDMCCLPHASGMTYFSPKNHVHKAYEAMARTMYPDSVPTQTFAAEELHIFDDRRSFSDALNALAEAQLDDPKHLLADPAAAVISRLHASEKAVAALLFRYYEDAAVRPGSCRFIFSGARLLPSGKLPPLTASVTAEGVTFTAAENAPENEFYAYMTGHTFRAAHRRNGLFTLSPVDDPDGRCIISGSTKLRQFDPGCKKMFFALAKPV